MFLLIPIVLAHLLMLVNTRFTLWPEVVVYPYLLNNGFALYKDIINPYPPVLPLTLQFITKLYGYNPINFQILTWITIILTDLTIYRASSIMNTKLKLIAPISFVILSIPLCVNGLWFDLIQTPFIIISFYYFYKFLIKPTNYNLVFSLFFLSITIFIKQQAIWIALSYFLIIFIKRKLLRNIAPIPILLSIIFLPSIIFIYLANHSTILEFIKWNIIFPLNASSHEGYILYPSFKQSVILLSLLLFLILGRFKLERDLKLLTFVPLSTLLFVYPRFDYFHLIPFLALIALFVPNIIKNINNSTVFIKAVFAVNLLILTIFTTSYVYKNWTNEIRFFERDIQTSALFLAKITRPNEILYIQNGPDQLFPLSRTLPTKPWADEFSWYLEGNNLQDQIVESLSSQKPMFVIYKPYLEGAALQLGSYRPQKIANFIDGNYHNKIKITNSLILKEKNQ